MQQRRWYQQLPQNGHSDAIYATIAPVPFTPPVYAGAVPVIPARTTTAQTGVIIQQHTENMYKWRECSDLQEALKNQIYQCY